MVNEKRIYKNALKMTYGWYNWTLANQSRAGQIYFASTPQVDIPLMCFKPVFEVSSSCCCRSPFQRSWRHLESC